jgi:nitroreductase
MTQTGPAPSEAVAALVRAAAMAGLAPSVHNTQPWHWTVLPDRLELSAVRERQLAATDPQGRLLVTSCGAALHHARVALAAQGWACRVDRLPEVGLPDLLAVLTPTGRTAPEPAAMRLVQDMRIRQTDRRPLAGDPVPDDRLRAVAAAAGTEGVGLHLLTGEQVYDLASAAHRAGAVEAADEGTRRELAYWTGRLDGLGVPAASLPAAPPATTVPNRDFGRPGELPDAGHDEAASYGLLYGGGDEPWWWLRAGEALSAVWLTAINHGVSVLPLSAVIEVTVTRAALRRLVAGLGWPYLVLRLGSADPGHAGPAGTPRLAASQVVDTSAVHHLLDED